MAGYLTRHVWVLYIIGVGFWKSVDDTTAFSPKFYSREKRGGNVVVVFPSVFGGEGGNGFFFYLSRDV